MTEEQLVEEYKLEEERLNKLNTITYKFQRKAKKSHFCETCGCEIPKGDLVWWYKPYPIKNKSKGKVKWFKWRTRCIDHPPVKYEPSTFNEEVSESSYEYNGYGRY